MDQEGDTNKTTSLLGHTTAHQRQHSSSGARSRTDRNRSIDLPPDDHRSPLDLQPNDPHEEDDRRSRLLQPAAYPSTVQQQQPLIIVRYRECMKNHAPSSGRHVVDGCGEFMPRSDDGVDLRCAACDCHRNFHRHEIDSPPPTMLQPAPRRTTASTMHRFPPPPPPPVIMMNFGGGSSMGAESSSKDLEKSRGTRGYGLLLQRSTSSHSRKRHRTKFSKEQKQSMSDFAERIGWRIDKGDESEVDMFCSRIGVKRKVFKVWMHNNKQRSGKGNQSKCK